MKERENLIRRVGWSEVDEELVEEVDSYFLLLVVLFSSCLQQQTNYPNMDILVVEGVCSHSEDHDQVLSNFKKTNN